MKKVDYKGKYFILQDEAFDDMDYVIGEIKDEDITDAFLELHIETCIYYGIPPYCGKNQELHKRIDDLMKYIES
jgi:hypothetical protein